jgi:hypothetical protein
MTDRKSFKSEVRNEFGRSLGGLGFKIKEDTEGETGGRWHQRVTLETKDFLVSFSLDPTEFAVRIATTRAPTHWRPIEWILVALTGMPYVSFAYRDVSSAVRLIEANLATIRDGMSRRRYAKTIEDAGNASYAWGASQLVTAFDGRHPQK